MSEERRKFTYRYGSDIEDVLKKTMKNYNISSLNKLIDKLIFDATLYMPKEIKRLEKELSNSNVVLQKTQQNFVEVEQKYEELRELLIRGNEIEEKIKSHLNGKKDTNRRKS